MTFNGQKTTLQKGDKCTWHIRDGTISLSRGTTHMRREAENDDKYLMYPRDHLCFSEIVSLLASAVGLTPEMVHDDDSRVTYEFK